MSAAIYLRLSKDLTGAGTAVGRQEEDCRARAGIDGFSSPQVYTDNDMSAFAASVKRPAFENLLELCRTGVISVIYVYRVDRLARASREWAKILPLVDDFNVRIVGVADGVDTSTHGGRLILDVLAAVARDESARISQRVKRQKQQARALGTPMGGPRAFGSLPEEAEYLREAARLVLEGRPQESIARDWNHQNISTSAGSIWTASSLQKALSHPRNRAILGDSTWLELQHLYSQRRRPGRPARSLLAPVLRCTCNNRMTSHYHHSRGRRYTCKSCHLSIHQQGTDSAVTTALLRVLQVQGYWDEPQDNTEALSGLTGQLQELQSQRSNLLRDYYIKKMFPEEDFNVLHREIQDQIDALESRVVQAPAKRGPEILENFHDLSVDAQREIISEVFEYIQVKPADRKVKHPNPADRLLLKFYDGEEPLLASSVLNQL